MSGQRVSNSKFRILYIDEVSEIGGGGYSLNYLMRYLDRKRFEPFLISPRGPILDLAVQAGVRTFPYTFRKRYVSISVGRREIPLNPYRLMYRLADACRIVQIVRREKIDIVHTNNLDAHLTGWFLNKIFGVPVMWHVRIHWPRSFYRISWPTRIIFVSKALRDASLGARCADSRGIVIYNGISSDDFCISPDKKKQIVSEFGLTEGQPIIGTVGRLQPIKRQDLFIKTIANLVRNRLDVAGIIVGSEIENRGGKNYYEYLMKLTCELGINHRVIFTGQRSDVARLVGAMDVFVFCSDRDSNPRTVLEAMVMARPIVATNSGGVPEMLDNGRAGILVENGNAEALAQGVLRLIHNPAFAAKLGQVACQRAKTVFSIQEHARKVEQIYEEILSR